MLFFLQEAAIAIAAKRAKIDTPLILEETEAVASPVPVPKLPELIELSESFIAERLSVEIATELVMDSMVYTFLCNKIYYNVFNTK